VKDLHWTRYWVAGWVRRHLLQAKRVVGELRRGQTRDWAPRFGLRRLAGALVAVSIAALVGVPLVSVSQAAAAAAFGVDNAMSVNATGAATISGFSTTQAGDLLVAFVSADGPSGGHQSATVSGGRPLQATPSVPQRSSRPSALVATASPSRSLLLAGLAGPAPTREAPEPRLRRPFR